MLPSVAFCQALQKIRKGDRQMLKCSRMNRVCYVVFSENLAHLVFVL